MQGRKLAEKEELLPRDLEYYDAHSLETGGILGDSLAGLSDVSKDLQQQHRRDQDVAEMAEDRYAAFEGF